MLTKRLKICIATGAILGVFCIVGASLRSGFQRDAIFICFMVQSTDYGFDDWISWWKPGMAKNNWPRRLFWFGRFSCFYLSTGFTDVVSFLAGIVYGIIIEYIAFKYDDLR